MQGSFSVWTDHKKGHTRVKDLARQAHAAPLFLHEKAVLFCKRREERRTARATRRRPPTATSSPERGAPGRATRLPGRAPARGPPACSALTDDCRRHHEENVKGDAKKFEIWYNAREEVYIIQVGSGVCAATKGARERFWPRAAV